MPNIHSFRPVAKQDALFLILGSMPGKASLAAGEYYAHPRNLFWRIVGELFAIPGELAYDTRLAALADHGVALWDVLKTCERASSLDSDIVESSIEANDLAAFLIAHPKVKRILFNGAKAEASFRRYVTPGLFLGDRELKTIRLPSTSPANASWSWERKLAAWRGAFS